MAGPIPSISAQNVSVPKPHRTQVTPRNLRTESANVTQSIHPPHQKQASNGLPLILADYRFQGNTLDSSSLQKHCTNNGATLTTGPFKYRQPQQNANPMAKLCKHAVSELCEHIFTNRRYDNRSIRRRHRIYKHTQPCPSGYATP
jgi:hypothetical protein